VDPERIVVLPVGTDVERFGPAPEVREDGQFRVLSVARLEQGKGVEDLAIAAGLLARRGVDVRVSFLGRGPMRGRLERVAAAMGISDRVEFPGFVPWGELDRVYRRHDAFVLASGTTRNWREQLGFAVLEVMVSGLPVLVGDSGSLPEVAGRPESLVRPHDPPSLADALEELAGDPGLRAERGAWNRQHTCSSATTSAGFASSSARSIARCWRARTHGRPFWSTFDSEQWQGRGPVREGGRS